MGTAGKLLIAGGALLAALAGGAAFVFFRRPLALYAWLGRRELRSAGLERRELAVPPGRLVCWRGGSGPTVVLLHGAGDSAATWSGVVSPLLAGRRLLVPDLPGHGASAPEAGPIPFASLLSALEALLDAEAPGARVTLVGNSMGAWLAFVYAERHPERVERIVAVNGGPLLGESGVNLMPATREEARRVVEALRAPGSARIPDFVLDDIVRTARSGPIARLAAAGDMPRFLMDGRLQRLAVPVDLLWGEADRVVPLDYARKMASLLPNVRLTTLPECGHVPHQELPAGFARALGALLSQQPAAGGVRAAS